MNPYILIGATVLFSVYSLFIYNKGYTTAEDKYKQEILVQNANHIKNLRSFEHELLNKQNVLVSDYLKQIEELKHKNEDITHATLANTTKCLSKTSSSTRRVPSGTDKSHLTCYRDSQLREQIKRSLDIARECDALALRYNTLLKVCSN